VRLALDVVGHLEVNADRHLENEPRLDSLVLCCEVDGNISSKFGARCIITIVYIIVT